ncbi:reverse transcriptase domain-containing protein [Tanacetum coccineum]
MSCNIKTYDGSGDPEDHLKIFQTTAKIEMWAMPRWCHMFNFTLIGATRFWFDKLPPESIDSYVALRKAFLANFLQQKKYTKDLVEIHHIKQREGESTTGSQTQSWINMKLNPKKCTLRAEEGMFLGHVVNMKEIKACSEKTETFIRLQSPRTLKEVQSLYEKLASQNRFLYKSAEKSLPSFKTLKNCIKKSDFQWTSD